jgi:protein-tyrosine-phosphatase
VTATIRPTDLDRIVDDLAYHYDGVFSRAEVAAAVEEGRALLEPSATVTDFLPVLVGRFARDQLLATAQVEGRVATAVPEVVFVCVRNAGRSQLAAALAQHLAGPRVHVRSAGSRPAGGIDPTVVSVLAERGIALTEAFPKPLTDRVVRAADVIVTMGCGDACPVYPGKRYLDWDVPDPEGQPVAVVRDIRDDLQARVSTLLRELGV